MGRLQLARSHQSHDRLASVRIVNCAGVDGVGENGIRVMQNGVTAGSFSKCDVDGP